MKYDKILAQDATKKEFVLKILEIFDGESYNDAKEILDLVAAILKDNTFLDYSLARDMINSGD